MNLLENPGKKVRELISFLREEIERYFLRFGSSQCSFRQDRPRHHELLGWYNKLTSQGYLVPHTHPSGWLSGVVYLRTISDAGDGGAIEFSLASAGFPI